MPAAAAQRMISNPAVYLDEMRSRLAAAEAGRGLLKTEIERMTVEKGELEARFNSLSAVETQIARLKGKLVVRERPEVSLEQRGGQKLLAATSTGKTQEAAPAAAAPHALQPVTQQIPARMQPASENPNAQILEVQKRLTVAEGEKARLQKDLQQILRAKMELEAQFNNLAALGAQTTRLKKEIAAAQHLEWVRQGASGAADEKGGQRLVQALSTAQAENKTSTPSAVKAPGPQSANREAQ
jgi:predicted nuclease with TOPRIM domain